MCCRSRDAGDFRAGLAGWTIEPNVHAATDTQLYRFITEMQIGIHISLVRDIWVPRSLLMKSV
jgi:hypothetical protein